LSVFKMIPWARSFWSCVWATEFISNPWNIFLYLISSISYSICLRRISRSVIKSSAWLFELLLLEEDFELELLLALASFYLFFFMTTAGFTLTFYFSLLISNFSKSLRFSAFVSNDFISFGRSACNWIVFGVSFTITS
jgi:hypothetical protein